MSPSGPSEPPRRGDRLNAILEAALQLPTDERSAFLDRECESSHERHEIDQILAESDAYFVADTVDHAEQASFDVTPEITKDPAEATKPDEEPVPETIDRYRVVSVAGRGGFGCVYIAIDDELDRTVAIKVPRRDRIRNEDDIEAYLSEARIVAQFKHPHLVDVYDAGRIDDGRCFVVSRYIDGGDLGKRMAAKGFSHREAAELVAAVADALHYAHGHKIIHRDVKPANILIDGEGQAYVADFGLALWEENYGVGQGYAGTAAYMSPEQARKEGHLVDGRSDIFSLGVVLYELLAGERPFTAATPLEIVERIRTTHARPPRQLDDRIDPELERICLKALAKRIADRYTTAKDFADDLRAFLSRADAAPAAPAVESPQRAPRIVPKGLRSFEPQDADFFLDLLPGPRDRDGLPESIRFWKARLEARGGDATFRVGLLYGPSGCGKSSLVKAGLLPRLADHVLPILVEATANGTEAGIAGALSGQCPNLAADDDLVETMAALRRGQGTPAGKKVVLVIDQFEQWLHARRGEEEPLLVRALRQCDGEHLQCLVMVRDDFWMAVTNFMDALELRAVPHENAAAVDLFGRLHAREVLTRFGRAYGRLEEGPLGPEAEAFLDRAIDELVDNNDKIVCVRLALFADMIKEKPWTAAVLADIGGTEGVGVRFLDETFTSAEYRRHEQRARQILEGLLPESHTEIRGPLRSGAELRRISGYDDRPREFNELIQILDATLRLITPTDPEGQATDGSEAAAVDPTHRFYQLTHDYLVPSLRQWLRQGDLATKDGRARLALADRVAVWKADPRPRNLPSALETIRFTRRTDASRWSDAAALMMHHAKRRHTLRAAVAAVVLGILAWIGIQINGRIQAARLVDQSLAAATAAEFLATRTSLAGYRRWADPVLREQLRAAEAEGSDHELKLMLGLLPTDASLLPALGDRLLKADAPEFEFLSECLKEDSGPLLERLRKVALDEESPSEERFRAMCALSQFDGFPEETTGERWRASFDLAADRLMDLSRNNRNECSNWITYFGSTFKRLLPSFVAVAMDPNRGASDRSSARHVIAIASTLSSNHRDEASSHFRNALKPKPGREFAGGSKARALAALALLEIGLFTDLAFEDAGDFTSLSFLFSYLERSNVDPNVLVAAMRTKPSPTIRFGLMLALGAFPADTFAPDDLSSYSEELLSWYESERDPSIHSAAEWLLRKWEKRESVSGVQVRLAHESVDAFKEDQLWAIDVEQHDMVRLAAGEFVAGSRPKYRIQTEPPARTVSIERSFAIATKEVTVEQFDRFFRDQSEIENREKLAFLEWCNRQYDEVEGQKRDWSEYAPTPDCPQIIVTWDLAALYCNWLSERNAISEREWCFTPTGQQDDFGIPIMKAKSDLEKLSGYRLPNQLEWEYACRAGTETQFYFGNSLELINDYVWSQLNSDNVAHPVGALKPNRFGLFDTLGNVWEWCHEDYIHTDGKNYGRAQRGGSFRSSVDATRPARPGAAPPQIRVFHFGFRVVRTLDTESP